MDGNFVVVRTEINKRFGRRDAEAYLALPSIGADKDVRCKQHHVDFLLKEMREGRFRTGLIGTVEDERGRTFRANGQHECLALVAAGSGMTITAYVEHCRAANREGMLEVYDSYDRPESVRTWGDFLASYIAGAKVVKGWPLHLVKLLIDACGWVKFGRTHSWRRGVSSGTATRYEKAQLIQAYPGQCRAMHELLAVGKAAEHLLRNAPVSAMMETLLLDEGKAVAFWTKVRDGEELKKGEGPKLLRDALTTSTVSIGVGTRGGSRAVTFNEMYTWCVQAWNAYREGRTLAFLRFRKRGPLPEPR